jgi:hypothetical protein
MYFNVIFLHNLSRKICEKPSLPKQSILPEFRGLSRGSEREPQSLEQTWDRCYDFLKIFSPKNLAKILTFFAQTTAWFFLQKCERNIGL